MRIRVLPASAGMILLRAACQNTWPCAPRIRGDDPATVCAVGAMITCSPHPRG